MLHADSHVHFFEHGFMGIYDRPSAGGDDLAIYESFRARHRIDRALIVGYEGQPYYRGNNAYIASIALRHPWVAPVAYVPAGRPAVPEHPFIGISVYLENVTDAAQFAAWPRKHISHLARGQMIVSISARPDLLAHLREALGRFGGCKVLINHLGQPDQMDRGLSDSEIDSMLRPLLSLAPLSHVGVKLSGLYSLSTPMHLYPHSATWPLVERIANAFGGERLYWGSDFSPALDYVSFAQTIHAIQDLPWTAAERYAIMGENLRRLIDQARS
jgi:L-fuconolactonase